MDEIEGVIYAHNEGRGSNGRTQPDKVGVKWDVDMAAVCCRGDLQSVTPPFFHKMKL